MNLARVLSQCASADEGLISRDELLRRYVMAVLTLYRGNKAKTARALGVHRRTVYRWIDRPITAHGRESGP